MLDRIIQGVATACSLAAGVAWLAQAPGPARAASDDDASETATITVARDTVAVFLLPSAQEAGDAGATQTRSAARTALAQVKQCLGTTEIDYRLVFARRVDVHSAGHVDTFGVGDPSPDIAALLARPGLNTRVIYVTGPEALAQTLPYAVREYFGKKRC